ncbi:hypothetical protein [Parafilimonas sp.]|uniref:hypothetical protein n=1 Tax=Parafilimonas sp. TaxID=1969739 RepID=UPI003F7F695B
MDDTQQNSNSQSSGEQSGQSQQQTTTTVDISSLRPDPTDTSHFSTRSQNDAGMQRKGGSNDE